MKIRRQTNNNLIIENSAGCIWLFGFFFVAIAGIFIAGLLGLFNNLNEINDFEKSIAWIISLSGFAAGIWIIYSNPASYIEFDKLADKVIIKRQGIMRNEQEIYKISDVKDFIIIESKDSDGDRFYYPAIKLFNEKEILLSSGGSGSKEYYQKEIDLIKDFIK